MAKQITKLTPEELKAAQKSLSTSKLETPISDTREKDLDYIARLKDSEIIEYFKSFGFQHLNRLKKSDDFISAIQVVCDDFFLVLSNFDVFVDIHKTTRANPNSKFDMMSFLEYCAAVDISPEKALGELVQIELLGQRFHSYEKAYTKHKQTERKDAFEKLPKDMQKKLGVINDKREHEINAIQNKLKFGDFEGEPKTNI